MSGSVERLNALLADRYRIERELGAGGMATVYFAEDLRHHRPVAIKVLRPDLAASLGAERFLREIEIAARLHHPHILPLYDSGGEHDLLFYVMPYVEGESLRHRLSRGALPLAEAVQIIRDVADALAYSHQRGVVHRDIKPENILLSSGHALVTDFGVAKAVSDATTGSALTGAGVTLGTPAYMAPEQATADPGVDHRADLYALGVTAWEMLAGAHPFGVRPPQAMVGAHLSEAPVAIASRRSGIPASLAGLVMQLLSKDPAQRPQRAEDVVRAIDQGALPAGARPRWSRRAVAASAVLVLAVAAGAAVAWNAMSSGAQESPDGEGRIETIAVLPFVNTSGVPGDDYFSDGMTDELAHAVSRIPSVRLAGRTSSYAFKGKSATAQEIGRTLDVEAFVDGTVRRAGERLRVSAQLVSTRDGKVLWDSVFETRSSDVFGIQDEFTVAIVSAIAPALSRGTSNASDVVARGTRDPEA
ncbi:MAG TPA: serine/threonine-protein kinase, partial [Gemmatimonadaceae bacterium]